MDPDPYSEYGSGKSMNTDPDPQLCREQVKSVGYWSGTVGGNIFGPPDPHPDPLVSCTIRTDPDPAPDPSINKQNEN
jgi:hypothetical protein